MRNEIKKMIEKADFLEKKPAEYDEKGMYNVSDVLYDQYIDTCVEVGKLIEKFTGGKIDEKAAYQMILERRENLKRIF